MNCCRACFNKIKPKPDESRCLPPDYNLLVSMGYHFYYITLLVILGYPIRIIHSTQPENTHLVNLGHSRQLLASQGGKPEKSRD